MFDNSVKGGSETICKEIIVEFDGNLDKTLSFDEFLNVVLPAANEGLRNYCLFHKRQSRPPSALVEQMASRILQIEAEMAIEKVMTRKALFSTYIQEVFSEISGRK
jgi:hypothetical protein